MPITKPSDLDIPEKMDDVLKALTDQGRSEFMHELVDALAQAKVADDLAPVQHVVNAWYVSRQFLTHPEIDPALDKAFDIEGSNVYTIEELGTRLGVV